MSVYFASCDSLIKIGTSRDPQYRMRALDSYLLAVAPGSYEEERVLHDWFAADCVYGEWFRPSRALLALIDGLITEEAAHDLGLAPLRTGRMGSASERSPSHDGLFAKKRKSTGTRSLHGTAAKYNSGCRCDVCRADARTRHREQRLRKQGKSEWAVKVAAAVARADAAEKAEASA